MQIDGMIQILRSKKIIDCTPKEIIEKLSLIYMLVGLRPQHFPTQQEDVLLITFIKKHFARQGIDELYYAFELAITGELDIDDVKVYDQFTLEYLMRIMNSYKRHMIEKCKEIQTKIKPVEPEVPKLTDDDKRQEIDEWRIRIKKDGRLLPFYLYDWMKQLKIIDMEESEILKYYGKAIRIREHELRRNAETFGGDRKELKEFMHMKSNHFANITRDEERHIDSIFKRLVVIDKLNEDDQENGCKS